MFRNPKSTNEARQYAAAVEQDVKVRPKRNLKRLPNEWDDRVRCYQRSWKQQRRTKYRT